MATTYQLISSITVGAGGAANIEFTSIPQTYTDLVVKLSSRTNRGTVVADFVVVSFNGNTANRTSIDLYGSGGMGFSGSYSTMLGGLTNSGDSTASTFGNTEIYIPNYTSSNNKSINSDSISENNATEAYTYFNAGSWSNSSAITSITLTPNIGTLFNQYSTAYLYGISNA